MNIQSRLDKLENYCPKQRTVKDMTDNELAELITGIPGTKSEDLTEEYLDAVIRGEQPLLPYKRRSRTQF